MNIVTYLKATVDDVAKFCCGQGQFFKTLAMDTTFNIAEYYLTQTVYRHLVVLKQRDDEHPWFPGPTMAHRDKVQVISAISGKHEGEEMEYWQI